MIPSNELREGNWIFWLGEAYKIDWRNDDYWHGMLEKCGFVKEDDYWVLEGFKLWHDGTGFYHINSELLVKPDFLHQLQNLYFTLTGEELEINL